MPAEADPKQHPNRAEGARHGDWLLAEARKEYKEVDVSGGRVAVKDGEERKYNPRASGEGAAETERAGANEAEDYGAGTAEGHRADMGKRLTGADGAGARGVGGGKGVADQERESLNAILIN